KQLAIPSTTPINVSSESPLKIVPKGLRQVGRYHVIRTLALAMILVLVGWGAWEGFGRMKSEILRDRLLESPTAEVPSIVKEMGPYRHWIDPMLREARTQAEEKG